MQLEGFSGQLAALYCHIYHTKLRWFGNETNTQVGVRYRHYACPSIYPWFGFMTKYSGVMVEVLTLNCT